MVGGLRALNSWYFQSSTPIGASIGSGIHAISLFPSCLSRDSVRFMYKCNLDLIKKKNPKSQTLLKKSRYMFTVLGLHLILPPKVHSLSVGCGRSVKCLLTLRWSWSLNVQIL